MRAHRPVAASAGLGSAPRAHGPPPPCENARFRRLRTVPDDDDKNNDNVNNDNDDNDDNDKNNDNNIVNDNDTDKNNDNDNASRLCRSPNRARSESPDPSRPIRVARSESRLDSDRWAGAVSRRRAAAPPRTVKSHGREAPSKTRPLDF